MSDYLKTESTSINTTLKTNQLCKISFWFGIASIFLGWIGVIPLIGLVISIISLVKYNTATDKGLWMGVLGLILNLLYLVANAYSNGNVG